MGKRKRKVLNRKTRVFLRFFGAVIIVCELLSAIVLALPRFFDRQPYVIISDSMYPTLKAGDLVYVRYDDPLNFEKDDLICFYMNEMASTPTTHRVVENDREQKIFITKGDNNASEDILEIPYAYVLGKVGMHLPMMGHLMLFLDDLIGKIVYFLLFAAALIALEIS